MPRDRNKLKEQAQKTTDAVVQILSSSFNLNGASFNIPIAKLRDLRDALTEAIPLARTFHETLRGEVYLRTGEYSSIPANPTRFSRKKKKVLRSLSGPTNKKSKKNVIVASGKDTHRFRALKSLERSANGMTSMEIAKVCKISNGAACRLLWGLLKKKEIKRVLVKKKDRTQPGTRYRYEAVA